MRLYNVFAATGIALRLMDPVVVVVLVAVVLPSVSPKLLTKVTLYWYVPAPSKPVVDPATTVGPADGRATVNPELSVPDILGIQIGRNKSVETNRADRFRCFFSLQ